MKFMDELKIGGLLAAWVAAKLAEIHLALQVILVLATIIYIGSKTYRIWFPKKKEGDDDGPL